MKILVTGSTGLIGKELCRKLFEQGHQVVTLSRTPRPDLFGFPVESFRWASCYDTPPAEALENLDGVINLAGEPIFGSYFSSSKKQAIWDSRVVGTQNLVKALKEAQVDLKFYIGASAIGFYDFGAERKTEGSPAGQHWLAQLCQAWEKEHYNAPSERHAVIRIGLVLSHGADLVQKILTSALTNIIPRFGTGKQIMSWIHQEDLSNIFIAAVEGKLEGPINGVAPKPVAAEQFNDIAASFFKRRIFHVPVPSVAMKLFAGEPASVILESQDVSSEALKQISFKFNYSHVRIALKDALGLAKNPKTLEEEPCYTYEVFQHISRKPEKIWPFFCDPYNLEKITPSSLNFKIAKLSDKKMKEDLKIDYQLKLRGISFNWRTNIEEVHDYKSFVDTQIKGPYRVWRHTHSFKACEQGTMMQDRVSYQLPLLPFSLLAFPFVSSELDRIFGFRFKKIKQEF